MTFLKKKRLWLGVVAVVLPLVTLLALQFSWLSRLEQTSAIADRAALSNYISAVTSEVEFFYRSKAERALNIPDEIVRSPDGRLAPFLRKKQLEGVDSVFIARYSAEERAWDNLVLFDPASGEPDLAPSVERLSAINVALAPWEMLANKGAVLTAHPLTVDEKDRNNRIILNAISDDACRIVGIAGLVIDQTFFEEQVLPDAIERSLPEFFDDAARRSLVIIARDRSGEAVIGPSLEFDHEEQVIDALTFVFSDWTLALGTTEATVEQWARTNFILNLSLTALLAILLTAGVVFALRTASREVRLSQMKSDFVSNVSHELRTPLASIRLFGELLRRGRQESVQKSREYGEYIENESQRLTQLINNILDISKIESGAKSYQPAPTRLDEVVAKLVETLSVSLGHQGVEIAYEAPPEPLPMIDVDADAIRQALANLIDNAVKYSASHPQITVRLERAESTLLLSVEDRGVGISKEEQGKIFDRFHRVGDSLVHDVKGSGLGLSIVQHVVEAHQGQISVTSEPGAGSRFTIRLPLSVEAASAQRVDPHPQLGEV